MKALNTIRKSYICTQKMDRCPICRATLKSYRNPILTAQNVYENVNGQLCPRCRVFFTTAAKHLIDSVENSPERESFNIDHRFFNHSNGSELAAVKKIPDTILKQKTTVFSTSQGNMKAAMFNCYPCTIELVRCPICYGRLVDFVNPVTISKEDFVKVKGQACHHCDAFFTAQTELLMEATAKSPQNSRYRIDDSFAADLDYVRNSRCLYNLSSALMQVTVCAANDIRIYTIVSDKSDASREGDVLYYTHEISRILLTSVLLSESSVTLYGKTFAMEIAKPPTKRDTKLNLILGSSAQVEVQKGRNGGYYSPDSKYELVNGLVFSIETCRLEILPVTYDRETGIYFVDKTVFDNFRKKYGPPIVRYVASKSSGYLELREESLLRQIFGYNVGEKDDLSDEQRHKMLRECVDLGCMDVRGVVDLLKSLIRRNGIQNPQCVPKWQSDMEYIQAYRVDPERFVLIQRIRGF